MTDHYRIPPGTPAQVNEGLRQVARFAAAGLARYHPWPDLPCFPADIGPQLVYLRLRRGEVQLKLGMWESLHAAIAAGTEPQSRLKALVDGSINRKACASH